MLSEIQKKLKCKKSQYNKFGEYYYRSCEDILEAVKPLLPEGASIVLSDEMVEVAGNAYVKATAKLYVCGNANKSGDYYESTGWARETMEKKKMDSSQLTGAASTYARKYALNGLFAIDDTKDADATNEHKDEPKVPPQKFRDEVDNIVNVDILRDMYADTKDKVRKDYIMAHVKKLQGD